MEMIQFWFVLISKCFTYSLSVKNVMNIVSVAVSFLTLLIQLGGNFLLDEHGRVLFSHSCQSPLDRPSVEDILSAL